jgi:xanthine dehydrogenase accessory factor
MRPVIEEAVKLLQQGQPCVIATVVRTKGSTPQKAGAKLLVRPDGSGVGTLGGGCVEGDIWFAAKEIMRLHGSPVFKDYFLNEDIAARDGLVCGGTMYFFLDPVWQPKSTLPFLQEVVQAYNGGPAVAVATVVNTAPDKSSNLGAKMLVHEDGSTVGSLNLPTLEAEVVKAGKRVAAYGNNESVLGADGTEVFVEGFTTPPTLVIMGGGHVGKAVSAVAATLGFRIYVIDDRAQFSNKERFPEAVDTIVADFDKGLNEVPVNKNTFILVATRGHRYDDLGLEAAINTQARYVGLLGSKRKTLLIYKHLAKKGIPLERLKQVHAPVGLGIGAITPEELAISILSEIIMLRRGGKGGPLKMDDKYLAKLTQKLGGEEEFAEWEASRQSS